MPELPDVTIYVETLRRRIEGQRLIGARIRHPFLLRTVDPPISVVEGRCVVDIRRMGKRIVIGFDGGVWLVLHLMIAGRLHWPETRPKLARKIDLATFEFDSGHLLLTEAGTQKRASLHVVGSEAELAELDPGGLEVLEATGEEFARVLTTRNHTLKRALTNPRMYSGIGNAYSDEILHRAKLSPVQLTQNLADHEIQRLYEAVRCVLSEWVERLRHDAGGDFPEHVTAFRPEMAVHGRYGKPCPVCGAPVQRIRYAANETNYCARCQTGGRVLADRALSRLLKADWPRTLEAWEAHEATSPGSGNPGRARR